MKRILSLALAVILLFGMLAGVPVNASATSATSIAKKTATALDEKGRFVPTACPEVTFCAGGEGAVISTGSDVTDHRPLNSPVRKMRAGLLSVAVGVKTDKGSYTAQSGTIALYAQAPGLQAARLLLPFGNE